MARPRDNATPRTKSEVARQHIQEMILSGAARAGDHITTREISEALGISETPVREAIRSLAAEGWLDLQAHFGSVVASIKSEQLAEIYAIRGALSATAIELGGPLFDAARLDALAETMRASASAVAAHDVAAYTALNRRFHALLSDTANTQWTLKLLDALWVQTAAVGRGFEIIPQRMERSLDEHRAILAAVVGRDFGRAARLMVEHERLAGGELIAALNGTITGR